MIVGPLTETVARWLVESSLEACFVLAVALVASAALGRASARGRHVLWCLALAATLAAPLLSTSLPRYSLALAPRPFAGKVGIGAEPQSRPPVHLVDLDGRADGRADGDLAGTAGTQAGLPLAHRSQLATPGDEGGLGRTPRWPGGSRLLALWLAGATAVLLWQALGVVRVIALTRRARVVPVAPGLVLSVDELRREVGVRRPVETLISAEVANAMTWGWLRPVVMLSSSACDWSDERRRMVLQHELLHVRRSDWLVRALAQIVCAIYWFLPLAWLARRRLLVEQELACDEGVVALGHRRSDYAQHLLALASLLPVAPPRPLAALEMAQRSKVEVRLMSILDSRPHRSSLLAPAVLVLAALVPGLAAMEPWVSPTGAVQAPTPTAPPAQTPAPGSLREAVVELQVEPLQLELEAAELEPLAESLALLEAEIEPLMARSAELELQLEPYEAELMVLEESIEPIVSRIEEAEQRATGEQRAGKEEALEELRQALAQFHGQVEQHLRQLHQSMEPLHREMESLHQQMRPAHEQMEKLHRQMESQRSELEKLHEQLRPEHLRLREVHEQLRPVHEQMGDIQRQMEPFHRQMEELNRSLEPLHEQMRELHETMEPIHRRMGDLQQRLHEELHAEVRRALERELAAAGAAVADIESLTLQVLDVIDFQVEGDQLSVEGSPSTLGETLGAEIRDSALVERLVSAILALRLGSGSI